MLQKEQPLINIELQANLSFYHNHAVETKQIWYFWNKRKKKQIIGNEY